MSATQPIIRHPGGAGFWYPEDTEQLRQEVQNYLHEAERQPAPGKILALISPHAGYRFSGPIAGAAFKQVQGVSYDTVVVVGLSHRVPVEKASVFDGDFYETPLGQVPVDQDVVKTIMQNEKVFHTNPRAHATRKSMFESGGEHSVENQVPFLQEALGEFKFVEILINAERPQLCKEAGKTIAKALKNKEALLVASTDLTHYPPYEDAVRIDKKVLDILSSFDLENIWEKLSALEQDQQGVRNLSCVMCSKAAVMTVFEAAKQMGADEAKTLLYQNSGDTSGRHDQVVGYGALAVYDVDQPAPDFKEIEEKIKVGEFQELTPEQRKTLLQIARKTLEAVTRGEKIPEFETEDPILQEKRGCFVTLTKDGQLRGCIGRFDTESPIYRTVAEMAESAALKDPRFTPVQPEEVDKIQIEMTIFPEKPRRRIKDIDEIVIGKHGLYIKKGRYGGTLLPQVAIERGWDRETFLEQTCRKAFLPPDAWKDADTEIYVYPGEIFHEDKG